MQRVLVAAYKRAGTGHDLQPTTSRESQRGLIEDCGIPAGMVGDIGFRPVGAINALGPASHLAGPVVVHVNLTSVVGIEGRGSARGIKERRHLRDPVGHDG